MPPQDMVISVASNIAKFVVGFIGHELGYVIFYDSNVEKLETEIQKLEAAKDAVEHSVDAAKRNGEEIEDNVKNWLKKVDGITAEAKQFTNSVGCLVVSCHNLCKRYQLSKKATEMASEIPQVLTEGNFTKVSYLPRLRVATTPFARGYEALDSRTSILNEIELALKDANIFKVGVYGMGGVGKSMLIKEVAWQAEKDGLLGAVIMATVTNSPDLKKIQGELADGLGLKFNEETEKGRAQRLRERITKEDAILVIMDDIWEKLDLAEVGIPFGDDHRGCKLLLTSRHLTVLEREMGTQKNFRLETLSEEESWRLFEKTAGEVVKDITLQPTAIKVARSCKDLPLLIVTVAKALKNQELHAWEDALIQLTKHGDEGLASVANEAIELSFKYLPSDQHRSLFLLIASGGQKWVNIEDLRIRSWGLGLFKNVESLAYGRNRLYKLIDDLRASCLLLEGERESVSMHDLVREEAVKIASRVQPFFHLPMHAELKEWPKMDQLKNCRYITLPWCYIPELPESLECPELEILVICSQDNYLKVPDHFFSGVRDLKVLDLGGMMCSPSLPVSLSLLINLKALYLYKCILVDITIVSELTSLEILSLEGSEIQELPKEMRQLTQLRLLNLGDCSCLKIIPANLISSLSKLEELYTGNCSIQWEVEESNQSNHASLGELRDLQHLRSLELQIQDVSILPTDLHIFGELERYNILIGDGWKWSRKYGGYLETPRVLKLKLSSTTITHLDHGVKLLLNGVQDLQLAEMNGITSAVPKLNGEGFPHLKYLHIQNSDQVVYIIDATEWIHPHVAFPNLQSMVLQNLMNLEQICWGPLPIQLFTKLQIIKVKDCERLQNLFSVSIVRNLQQLLEIDISGCKFMTNIIAEQGEDSQDSYQINFPRIHSIKLEYLPVLVSFCSERTTPDIKSGNSVTEVKDNMSNLLPLFGDKVAMPNLEIMKLTSISMSKLWDDSPPLSCIQNLTSLTVDNCCRLTYLFPSSMVTELAKLHSLEITNCQMMEEIIVPEGKQRNHPSALKPFAGEKVAFPNLETLIISNMENLKSLWHDGLDSDPFPKLIKMEISSCQKLGSVFPSYMLNSLQHLETVLVADCGALKVVFETKGLNIGNANQGRLTTQAKALTLRNLPMLEQIWSDDPRGILQFQNLCTVIVTQCPTLSHVFPLSVATKLLQLQVLDIKECGVDSIVAKDVVEEATPRLVFPRLTSLTLWNLEELESFYPETHIFSCPVLRKLDVYHCDELEIFRPKSQNSQKAHQQSQSLFEEVMPNLEDLSLSKDDLIKICSREHIGDNLYTAKTLSLQCFHDVSDEFPTGFLQRFSRLENLRVECSSFTEIFSLESAGAVMKLKALKLNALRNLKYLCREEKAEEPVLQNLECMEVIWCSALESIVPFSSWELFQNLTELSVGNCSGLVNIVTSSSATSLKKLRDLSIYNCELIEEIVGSENGGDAGEISFIKLKILQLVNLSSLKSFCKGNYCFKFPLLEELVVVQCPAMGTFSEGILSTPLLRRVYTGFGADLKWIWNGDLNTTIRQKFSQQLSMQV